jgi:hypothetical protein
VQALAGQIAGTLALCGEASVQADTAKLFLALLQAREALSETQLLVRSCW